MWRKCVFGGVCVWACLFTVSVMALSQEPGDQKPKDQKTGEQQPGHEHDPMQMDPELMKKLMPGEHHQHLQTFVGEWKCHCKFWMDPAMPEAMEMEAQSTITSALDGRFIKEVFTGSFGGMPFEGNGTSGYDNMKEEYVSTWIDNHSTGIFFMSGKCDQSGKVFDAMGEHTDPHTGKPVKVRSKHTVINENKHVLEMFKTPEGGTEYKGMEIVYERAAATPAKPMEAVR